MSVRLENHEPVRSGDYFGLPLSSEEYVSRYSLVRSMFDNHEANVKAILDEWREIPPIQFGSDRPYEDELPEQIPIEVAPITVQQVAESLGRPVLEREVVLA